MLAYREYEIHYMDGFHSQIVGSHLRTCPRTGPSMSRHDSGVGIALIHDCATQNEPLQTVASVRLDSGRDWSFFIYSASPESGASAIRHLFAFVLEAGMTCAGCGASSGETVRTG